MRGAYLFPVLHGILVLGRGGGRGGGRPEHLPNGGEPAAAATCRVLLSHACLPARLATMARLATKSANLEAGRSGERKEGGGSKWRRRDGANLTPTRACSACGAGGGIVVLSACGPRITGERTEQLGAIPDFPVVVYSCRCYSFTVSLILGTEFCLTLNSSKLWLWN